MSTQELVELITSRVIEQMRSKSNGCSTQSTASVESGVVVGDPVVTEAVLESRMNGNPSVRFSEGAILTPSARDYLHRNKIIWSKSREAVGATQSWRALLVGSSTTLETVLDAVSIPHETATDLEDGVRRSVNAATAGGGVILATNSPCVAACKANRSPSVRAASVINAKYCRLLAKAMSPNVFCINPRRRSHAEFRDILQTILAAGTPTAPSGWRD